MGERGAVHTFRAAYTRLDKTTGKRISKQTSGWAWRFAYRAKRYCGGGAYKSRAEARAAGEVRRREVVAGQIEDPCPWVFHRGGKPLRNYRKVWVRACRLAGVEGRQPHDLRRTAIRDLERAGVPRSAGMAMVGHRTEAVYGRYAVPDETLLKWAGELLENSRPGNVVAIRRPGPTI